jgi:hypothetical protein
VSEARNRIPPLVLKATEGTDEMKVLTVEKSLFLKVGLINRVTLLVSLKPNYETAIYLRFLLILETLILLRVCPYV